MGLFDSIFGGNQPSAQAPIGGSLGFSEDDQRALVNQGLLRAGLGILAANGRPGVTPFQAISGGLLGGLDSISQGANDLQRRRYTNAIEQTTMANMQRDQKMAQLGQQFRRPDGSFDTQGFTQALYSLNPQAAMEMQQRQQQMQIEALQAQKAQRDLSIAPTRQIESGGNMLTQELQPDGTWKTAATAPRWQPQQVDKSFQFVSGPNGQLYRANPRTGELAPVLNADGTPFVGGGKPGAAAGPGMAGGRQGAAAQIKAFDQRNKMQAEANNGINAAYKAAAQITNTPEEQLRAMSPEDLEKFINANGSQTAWGANLIHPLDMSALSAYGTQAAMANAVLNSQGNKPTDADIKYGKDASFGVGKPLSQNAKLIRQQIERGQKVADQINTLKTQFDNGGSLPARITPGGVGIGEIPGSPNQPLSGQSGAVDVSSIPLGAINMLKMNPRLRDQFDQKYGAGASAKVLGGG